MNESEMGRDGQGAGDCSDPELMQGENFEPSFFIAETKESGLFSASRMAEPRGLGTRQWQP